VDFVLGTDPKADKASGTVAYQDLPADLAALDIGPATRVLFAVALADAATVVWNGPMGAFENPAFVRGSESVAETLAGSKGLTIVGGGDTDAVLHQAKLDAKMDFISTGGGSFMEFMEGKELPAVTALRECAKR
jgi:phosphoglycerate kinase